MATPTFFRYLPARLKPLSSPAVWAPLTVFTLLSLFIWEYRKNPDWFNRPQMSNIEPSSTLTPEEQARLSEIDTLDLLLRNARVPSGDDLSTSLINPEAPEALSDETVAPDRSLAGRDNPFAAYEEQYKFPGASSATAAQVESPKASTDAAISPSAATPSTGGNALAEALNRQQATRNEGENRTTPNINTPRTSPIGAQPTQSLSEAALGSLDSRVRVGAASGRNFGTGNNSGFASGSAGSSIALPAPSSGVSAPFIRTTPEMSPPLGTTGYQVPSSTSLPVFNVPPQQTTRSSVGQFALPPTTEPSSASTAPTVNYTAPSFTQPEQNNRR